MIRAVVFDLWNTLVRSQAGSPFRRIQPLLRPEQAHLVDEFMWDSMRVPYPSCDAFLERWREAMGLDPIQTRAIRQVFLEASQDAELFPETLEALDQTRSLARVALLSNTQSFDMGLLEDLGLTSRLRVQVLSAAIGKLKPAPEAFEAARRRLGLFPGDLVMVGDSWRDDVGGALQAGWSVIWINREGIPRPEVEPDAELVELPDLERVPEVIRRLQEGARCATCLG
ncbi:MAG: HAD family hydrolase [Acidobacteria bacterium]|nr:HAD family hydrolase [Acidobacteriota bacterium]